MRNIALIQLREAERSAETIANALGSRQAAVAFVRAMVDYLEPQPSPTLFDNDGTSSDDAVTTLVPAKGDNEETL